MTILDFDVLDGVDGENQPVLYGVAKTCHNRDRLSICLYMMSDLPDSEHTLYRIETNLSSIFPPSIPHGYTPNSYKDFAASAIRFCFNYETDAVKHGQIASDKRMWCHLQKGCWRNTALGNAYALRLLRERNIIIQKGGIIQEPTVPLSDHSKRRYLDENKASDMLNARRNLSSNISETNESESSASVNTVEKHPNTEDGLDETELLNKVLDLLHYLSINSPTAPDQVNPTELNMSGSPSLIFRLLKGQQESSINIIEFHLSQQFNEWQVEVLLAD